MRYGDIHSALREVYGFDAFRGVQEEAIKCVLNGTDAFVLMATGGGKSLCYIIPPLVLGKTAIVVSPLVALMQDQVQGLLQRDVSACYLGSAQTDTTVWNRLSTFQLIYVTPEMTVSDRFRRSVVALDVCVLAVDEAHCVSEWGHDFRPEYRRIHELRKWIDAPVIAVTATATHKCRQDIVAQLEIEGPMLVTSVDRPNLTFTVSDKPSQSVAAIRTVLPAHGSCIVYVPTTRDADSIADRLHSEGIPCASYHAGKDMEDRRRVHADFSQDRLRVVVATLAFGMGVDKPDIRAVIHWGVPKTIEAYYQQAGRAGRDGDAALCVLFHCPADFMLATRLVGNDPRGIEGVAAMRTYCAKYGECRRNVLVRHFGEAISTNCERCDVCRCEDERVDISTEARCVLAATLACESKCGASTVIAVLRGNAKHEWLQSCPQYGSGVAVPVDRWREVLLECRAAGLIGDEMRQTKNGHGFAAVVVTEAGMKWYADESSRLNGRLAASKTTTSNEPTDQKSDSLFDRLSSVRKRLAQRMPPYMVCSNDTLRQLATQKPRSEAELLNISGFGKIKVAKFGDAFLECIRAHA